MNLYRVTNGYYNNLPLAVLVIARTEEGSIEFAREKFKQTDSRDCYSQSLTSELVLYNTEFPQCSPVIECSEINWDTNND